MKALWEYEGLKVRITTDEGAVFEGRAYDYTSAEDNDPEPESITVGHTELFVGEIKDIEILQ